MAEIRPGPDIEARRMELRGIIHLAAEVIGQYWPMRTFVHHNPLHSLEYLHFDEAVRRGRQFLGGAGYLPSAAYREYLGNGRIQLRHLKNALKPLAQDKYVTVGSIKVPHADVLLACLTRDLGRPAKEPLDALTEDRNQAVLEQLAAHLASAVKLPDLQERANEAVVVDRQALGTQFTLAAWCDRTLGSQITAAIDREMIKWCGAFLDEGHATWPMPGRDRDFYGAWRFLAAKEWSPCGIADSGRKITGLPNHPEEALLDSLDALGLPKELWQAYLSLELAVLPGWAGFIKWRGEATEYVWQQAHPAGLVKYLAVRLWYERELVQAACKDILHLEGTYQQMSHYMQSRPEAYFLRRERTAGRLPAAYADRIDRLSREGQISGTLPTLGRWAELANLYQAKVGSRYDHVARYGAARRLYMLTEALQIVPSALQVTPPKDLRVLVDWMDAFPEADQGPVWLRALEAGYQERLLPRLLNAKPSEDARAPAGGAARAMEDHPRKHSLRGGEASPARPAEGATRAPYSRVRPQSQSVFCIDVRSEPFRRHLESAGANETYGFAGFFAVFIRHRAWGKEHETEQFPVIMRAKNEVWEIPRSYLGHFVSKHETRSQLLHAGHTLLHDLKENVVTPYVMVESIGWFYSLPIVGKTVIPELYHRAVSWLRSLIVPTIATCMTVDKLTPGEIEEMLAADQRATIRKALRAQLGLHGVRVPAELVEGLRLRALNGEGPLDASLVSAADRAELSPDQVHAFVEDLRRRYHIDRRWASRMKARITRRGFTLEEQVLTVDTALRMMGLTANFARLVLVCAHGSTTENNPFESALDCGACGGNEGKPNARVLAAMANRPQVREQLGKKGIVIPSDTHFLAGQVSTTTEEVQIFDREDVPSTHRKDLARLLEDLREAGRLTSQERCSRFPDVQAVLPLRQAASHVRRRSADWSQIRPEWGLSGNAAFIIGRRDLTKGLDLDGRVFLHSYDYREDPTNRLLEVLLTAPQVVAQWINMEHYFSAVDNEVYGGGSKVYHNVVGRFGIMSGPWSDLRLGLARQTMMNGRMPYHEPMRLLTIVDAPRQRIESLIARHEVLQHYYQNEWVHLVALEPGEGVLYRYRPGGTWNLIESIT